MITFRGQKNLGVSKGLYFNMLCQENVKEQ